MEKIKGIITSLKNILNDKKKIYEILGATWFQKVVFKAEDLKFKFIDKFCPNIYDWYSKYCDHKVNKLCKETNDESKKNDIRRKYNYRKMFLKRELIEKKNRNYHMTLNNANSFYDYLLWNKSIHLKGLKRNIICIAGCSISIPFISGTLLGLIITFLIFNLISFGVNFQCVNLQNYNICRFEEKRDILTKVEKRKKESDAKNYSKVGEKIYKQLEENIERPQNEKIISSLNTLEELNQLKKLTLEIKRQRSSQSEEDTIKPNVRTKK